MPKILYNSIQAKTIFEQQNIPNIESEHLFYSQSTLYTKQLSNNHCINQKFYTFATLFKKIT
jgi:hypothetical protein